MYRLPGWLVTLMASCYVGDGLAEDHLGTNPKNARRFRCFDGDLISSLTGFAYVGDRSVEGHRGTVPLFFFLLAFFKLVQTCWLFR